MKYRFVKKEQIISRNAELKHRDGTWRPYWSKTHKYMKGVQNWIWGDERIRVAIKSKVVAKSSHNKRRQAIKTAAVR